MEQRTDRCSRCGKGVYRSRTSAENIICLECRRRAPSKQYRSVTEWACATCGKRCTRPPTRGQAPKYCSESCRDKVRYSCVDCGAGVYYKQIRCGSCYEKVRPRKQPKPRQDQRSPLRRAVEDGDGRSVIQAVLAGSAVTDSGCWEWRRKLSAGYPVVRIAGKTLAVHRLVLEAKHEAPLGSQHAHHICANPACVNPEHLQPVTHRENVAEMLARKSYVSRIAELESALAAVDPENPLLRVIETR